MQRMFVVLLFSVFLLCCRQELVEPNFNGEKDGEVILGPEVRTDDQVNEEEDLDDLNDDPKTFQEAYRALMRSVDRVKRVYNHRSEGFNESLFEEIIKKFGSSDHRSDPNFRGVVYASLKGDIVAINNLKRIVVDFNETDSEYNSSFNGMNLIVMKLYYIGNFLSGLVCNGFRKKDVNFPVLRYSEDVEGLNKHRLSINNFLKKWDEVVLELKTIINDAANFDTKEAVLSKLALLKFINTNELPILSEHHGDRMYVLLEKELRGIYAEICTQNRQLTSKLSIYDRKS
ncbi:hypothetical protein [Borrelia persica]|uniref:hypothetical protein n=1 Tax=Borrelia persica TaxID=44448 RepID=UPI0004665F72|nr:hypothetical protein [Borrelia persica]